MKTEIERVPLDDKLFINVFKHDKYIKNSIQRGDGWDRWMIPILEQIDHTGKVILDIGANIGADSLLFSYYAPVYAYEPLHYEVLVMNVDQKTDFKITPKKYALSDKDETKQFYHLNHNNEEYVNYGSGTFNPDGSNERCDYVCDFDTRTLDSEQIKESISFIKVDVQGEDLKVLVGAQETIANNDAVISVECTESNIKYIVDFLRQFGYKYCLKCPESMYTFSKFALTI